MEPIIGAGPAQGASNQAQVIKDSDTASFTADVLEASMEVPVIVDFWATWCGPCKTLGPILEKAVQNARGAVRLVKIDIDQNQELASQLRIQSVPTVYAFFQGRPVDGFAGAQPESQIKQFIERLAQMAGAEIGPSPVDQAMEQAKAALDGGQPEAAAALYSEVLNQEPDNVAALAGLLLCQLAAGETAAAREAYDSLTDEVRGKPEFGPVKAQLELAEASAGAGEAAAEIPALQAKLELNPKDHQARFELAMAFYRMNKREAAVDELLAIVQKDREWNEQAARKQLLTFFEAWGPTDPLTLETRRRLSSLLFS